VNEVLHLTSAYFTLAIHKSMLVRFSYHPRNVAFSSVLLSLFNNHASSPFNHYLPTMHSVFCICIVIAQEVQTKCINLYHDEKMRWNTSVEVERNFIQDAQGPHRSPESLAKYFTYKHMQSYFSLLWHQLLRDYDDSALDHLASKFELFWLSGLFKTFSKTFSIEADVEMFYHCGPSYFPRGP
jgi:hypothetical protein